jgi:hypothetical protein
VVITIVIMVITESTLVSSKVNYNKQQKEKQNKILNYYRRSFKATTVTVNKEGKQNKYTKKTRKQPIMKVDKLDTIDKLNKLEGVAERDKKEKDTKELVKEIENKKIIEQEQIKIKEMKDKGIVIMED